MENSPSKLINFKSFFQQPKPSKVIKLGTLFKAHRFVTSCIAVIKTIYKL